MSSKRPKRFKQRRKFDRFAAFPKKVAKECMIDLYTYQQLCKQFPVESERLEYLRNLLHGLEVEPCMENVQ